MAYLVTQMLLSLVCATVFGAALGWLACRVSARQRSASLHHEIDRRNVQLRQANADLATLQDEYDDLARQSREEIEELSTATESIPILEQNLDKSQQMVRQLMQKHAAQLHELSNERDALKQQLATATTDAAELERLHAGLEQERERRIALTRQIGTTPAPQTELDLEPSLLDERATAPEAPMPESTGSTVGQDGSEPVGAQFEPDATGLESLFSPVPQHDDLQKIMGIGPLTERGLNQLGITSYSQLAELEQHDIQKIATALDMGPEIIEGLDWVGHARRQLESVLEEL